MFFIVLIFAKADDGEVLGAAEELEPIRCVGGWHRAGVRMGRLGRALCKQPLSTARGGRQACCDPAQRGAHRADHVHRKARRASIAASRTRSSARRAADRASGVAPLQMALFGPLGFGRSSGSVWMGSHWSAMGGGTMGSSWTDPWPSRVITSRSSTHKKKSGWGLLVQQACREGN